MGHFAGIKRPNFGTVSTGTLTASDLRESFLFELRQQRPLHDTSRELIRQLEEVPLDIVHEVSELIKELDKYAPHEFYFGGSDADVTDVGYWPRRYAGHGRDQRHKLMILVENDYLYRELTAQAPEGIHPHPRTLRTA